MARRRDGPDWLRALYACGQSIWLDYISRHLLASGDLKCPVEEDGVRGVSSNASIFEKAITGGRDYRDILAAAECRD